MTDHPYLDQPRLCAGQLSTELRETIRDWFAAHGGAMHSETILAALAELAAEQIAAHPAHAAQVKAFNGFIQHLTGQYTTVMLRRPAGATNTTQ